VAGARRAGWVALAAAIVIGVGSLPGVQARVKSLGVLLEGIGAGVPRPFAPAVVRGPLAFDGVEGDVYRPPGAAPGVVLIPGAARLGKDDPRVVRLARAIARAGRVVFVPRMALAERRFVESDLEALVAAVDGLHRAPFVEGTVSMFGISYGGSFGLVAAADPRIRDRLAVVAVFGAYFDLVGVLQAVTTGVSLVDGRRVPWNGPPEARAILEEAAPDLAPRAWRPGLAKALSERDPSGLTPDGRALYELLVNRDPERTRDLASRMSPEARSLLRTFSPASVISELRAPVIAMHSLDDPAVPFAEAIRLSRALPEAELVVVRGFRHVDFSSAGGAGRALRDLLSAWRFATWLVGAQE
jgi:X-Pro dipeptidyl-peptidase (S15 family)